MAEHLQQAHFWMFAHKLCQLSTNNFGWFSQSEFRGRSLIGLRRTSGLVAKQHETNRTTSRYQLTQVSF